MQLRPYQHDAVAAVIRYFESGAPGHPLVIAPTGTGKSLIIAALVRHVLTAWPQSRVVMLTHVKELIQQNLEKLLRVWPEAPVGVYSAGLKSYHTDAQILFCGVQSAWNKAKAIASEERPVELILIDEAHRIPLHASGTYRRFIRDLSAFNPHLRLIGLTATPYRHVPPTQKMSGGYQMLTVGEERVFTDVAFDLSAQLLTLIEKDYLSALWPKAADYQVDTDGLATTRNGDYREDQVNMLMEQDLVIDAILNEAVPTAQADQRKHWLVFCAGVLQAQRMTDGLLARGISAGCVTGETASGDRDALISTFRSGKITALVSVSVLTTGFDAPDVDCLVIARPTLSPVLWVQMVGRGMRPTPDKIALEPAKERKRGCLVLDFCGNVDRHGPINGIRLRKPAPKKAEPMKVCPSCKGDVHLSAKQCPVCGHVFLPQAEISEKETPRAAHQDLIAGITHREPTAHTVSYVRYFRHIGQSGVPTLRVEYFAGFLRLASEWVCLDHSGYARQKAERWLNERMPDGFNHMPGSVDQLLEWIDSGMVLKTPERIHLAPNADRPHYPKIMRAEFGAGGTPLNRNRTTSGPA